MKRTTRLWFALLAMLFFYSADIMAAPAYIRLQPDTHRIHLGDVVILEVESTGLDEPLDIGPLEAQAPLLRETTGTRIAVHEGRVAEVRLRRMELQPGREGVITFGPLSGQSSNGIVTSNAVSVTVQAALDSAWVPEPHAIRIATTVSSTQPWVGQQVQLDIVMTHRYPITQEKITLPDLSRFDVVPVFEARRTDSPEGERQIAWRYLLHTRRSGTHLPGAAHWQGTLLKNRMQRAAFSTQGEALRIYAKPAAADGWWLPATTIELSDRWSRDPRTLAAGDQIERTLVLSADGVLPNQLPPLKPLPSQALTTTHLGTQRSQSVIGNTTRATAEYRFRMTAISPIPVFLDTVRVRWWDVQNDEAAEAIIPARRINIAQPQRPELLRDLALQSTGIHPWVWKLTELARWQNALLLISALAVIAAFHSPMRRGIRAMRSWLYWRAANRRMASLFRQQQWEQAYALAKQLARQSPKLALQHRASAELDKQLFSPQTTTPVHLAGTGVGRSVLLRAD